MKQIDIEGYTADEILNLPDEQIDALVLPGRLCFGQAVRRYLVNSKSKVEFDRRTRTNRWRR